MDRYWEKPQLRDQEHRRFRHQRENPSFSSTLLDAIYRSIDESNGEGEEELLFYRESMRKKKVGKDKEEEMSRACMIEKWMEKKPSCEKVATRRKSIEDFDKKTSSTRKDFDSVLLNSSSSSSESSFGTGGFSSSESESIYGTLSSRSSSYTNQRPKPIRTSINSAQQERYHQPTTTQTKPKHEGSFVKTKSKALKIYGDLKKVKQPISPGGRLASFLNSIFTSSNNPKKAKVSSSGGYDERKTIMKPTEQQPSTCSSASSFSRSCLSKTPSSRGKLSSSASTNGTKRSVRFYPVSVIVDEDCRPCGQKSLYGTTTEDHNLMAITTTTTRIPNNEELKYRVMTESRRVEAVARDLLKNYHHQKKAQAQEELINIRDVLSNNHHAAINEVDHQFSDEEEDEDIASCASSDLFELDNLSAIGIERYREELPVYETTHLDTNRAIANGLIV